MLKSYLLSQSFLWKVRKAAENMEPPEACDSEESYLAGSTRRVAPVVSKLVAVNLRVFESDY